MKYEEENYAKDLYDSMTQELVPLIPVIVASIEGIVVHWNCEVSQGKRSCKVRCFNLGKPQYLIRFDQYNGMQAWGRTYQKKEALSAMIKWLQGEGILLLYKQFEFIDKEKRALSAIEALVIACYPELTQSTTRNLYNFDNYICELWFCAQDRSCRIFYYGDNQFPNFDFFEVQVPNFDFFADHAYLFQVQTEQIEQMALVIKRLLHDHSMPSDIVTEFPWLDTGKLASFYEQDRGIEGEFLLSWDLIEERYNDLGNITMFPIPRVLDVIAQMRKKGYDRTLRAGQSLHTLIVSRSRRYGLVKKSALDCPWLSSKFN
jgi:hypothetical protein